MAYLQPRKTEREFTRLEICGSVLVGECRRCPKDGSCRIGERTTGEDDSHDKVPRILRHLMYLAGTLRSSRTSIVHDPIKCSNKHPSPFHASLPWW